MTTSTPAPAPAPTPSPAPKKSFHINLSADSTKRALRTSFHALVGLIGAVPTIVVIAHMTRLDSQEQVGAALTSLVVWAGVASKGINKLEDAGLIPAWLKG